FMRAEAHAAAEPLTHGTVGCVALDETGALAAGTSTGGVFGKLPGRVGDAPLIGAGTFADTSVAVSCTGVGEMFIRAAVAAQISHRMRFAGETLHAAAKAALDDVRRLGGDGGLIAVDAEGRIATPFNSQGMKRAVLTADGDIRSDVFEPA
ncbi:MAG: isoaspartyl peptidase/L-asparaginase, partial [Caulobacteraceae bacterium]|nr:isoaspartyl peptidase/L-asparaginase [Caulobacteraceae bacterium]